MPHFNIFHQHGTNRSGGVCIAIRKHLKGSRIDLNIENTIIVDVNGLSETVRIIAIYWPADQTRVLEELESYITKNTIITGDFNASVKEWGSTSADKRGRILKAWVEKNNLCYIPSLSNSSKRSNRNIDLTFTNLGGTRGETLKMGTSDHWPIMITCENLVFDKNSVFPHVHWKAYEAILTLLQEFWQREESRGIPVDDWYMNYVRFLAALKNRLTQWKEKEKFRPALPPYLIRKLQEVKRIRNKYYRERKICIINEETRVLLRVLTREVKIEIAKYKTSRWREFLSKIQETNDNKEQAFWLYLSQIYKHKSLPLSKLDTGTTVLMKENEIKDELYRYYSEQFQIPNTNMSDPYEVQIDIEYLELMNKLVLANDKVEMANIAEIKKHLSKLKPKKSCGFDAVSNYMIKRIPPGYISCLANCFNTWLKEYRYPDVWKLAKIITLNKLKAGVPRCEQTRPISLLATHSKLFEKIMLERIRLWTETNSSVPIEQSGFRPGCLLPTRVLSIYQEVKNNMTANTPTLAIYVDYQKAYDKVWHKGLIVKSNRLSIPLGLLKLIVSWLNDRRAYVIFGENKSDIFYTYVGLPQCSSLSPYLFIVYHCDLVACVGAHSSHIFADDLNIRISPPICRDIKPMIKFLEEEGTKICDQIANYSKKWKQPVNVSKTVAQTFHTQVQNPVINVFMDGKKLEVVKEFKYLGFAWTNKMFLKPTIDKTLENIQRTFSKLRWIKGGKTVSTDVLRRCFFAYSFPYFVWMFPLYPFLPKTQKESLLRKFRNGLRLVHRCPFARATNVPQITKEDSLEDYVKRYIKKRLERIEKSDLCRSPFYNDIFYWDSFHKKLVSAAPLGLKCGTHIYPFGLLK
ncbi:unnamed protein product [Rotaria socialis]|uniref:Reverse transcriptase domain-containing protein n=1 Tax=Rotaria socialis TaxID=392032 RepID=A0A818HK01_9BILA|nr:unnamed protein product [Rotaria socialis]CAF4651524.1 unnamed protein product [Rotaria socialis]